MKITGEYYEDGNIKKKSISLRDDYVELVKIAFNGQVDGVVFDVWLKQKATEYIMKGHSSNDLKEIIKIKLLEQISNQKS